MRCAVVRPQQHQPYPQQPTQFQQLPQQQQPTILTDSMFKPFDQSMGGTRYTPAALQAAAAAINRAHPALANMFELNPS